MTEATEAALFEAVIVPHRSLSRRALNGLILAIAVLCCINASIFIHLGAWPVGGFTGVELLLAAFLIRLNAHAARGSEMVLLSPAGLRIVRTTPKGQREERLLAANWLQVSLRETPGRVPSLLLVAHGVREEIARALGEEDKRSLALALEDALHRWRNPVFDNAQLRE